MGLDFTLYEIKDYDWANCQEKFDVEKVLYLSNQNAMLVVEWLYRNHIREINDKGKECYMFFQVTSDELRALVANIELVLGESDSIRRDVLAACYFPVKYTIPDYISSVEMFSEEYYYCLDYIRDKLSSVLNSSTSFKDTQMFVYNIEW